MGVTKRGQFRSNFPSRCRDCAAVICCASGFAKRFALGKQTLGRRAGPSEDGDGGSCRGSRAKKLPEGFGFLTIFFPTSNAFLAASHSQCVSYLRTVSISFASTLQQPSLAQDRSQMAVKSSREFGQSNLFGVCSFSSSNLSTSL